MRKFPFKCLILLQMLLAFRAQADFQLPVDQSELAPFFQKMLSGKIDLKGRDGCYALPRDFTIFGTEEIKYLKIEQNTISLIRSPSDSNGFVLADYTSFDKIIDSTRLGELMSLIVLPDGCDYWKILTSSGSLLFKEQKSSHSESVRIRFCTIKNSQLCFFWILFTTKMTDESVDNANKPLGDGGPLAVKVECIDISDTGEKVSIESKARRVSPEK